MKQEKTEAFRLGQLLPAHIQLKKKQVTIIRYSCGKRKKHTFRPTLMYHLLVKKKVINTMKNRVTF